MFMFELKPFATAALTIALGAGLPQQASATLLLVAGGGGGGGGLIRRRRGPSRH